LCLVRLSCFIKVLLLLGKRALRPTSSYTFAVGCIRHQKQT